MNKKEKNKIQTAPNVPVVGRFAPSPTGPLHFGSLVAAVASFLCAKSRGGRWLLRMEDVDTPRSSRAAADDILRTLDAFAFQWDGDVLFQHRRFDAYQDVLQKMAARGELYPCRCTRTQIARHAQAMPAVDGGLVYPGTCRPLMRRSFALNHDSGHGAALRFRVPAGEWQFVDGCLGLQQQNVRRAVGDFVLRRADGIFSYQLAVVVDDAFQGVNQVVRGADLLQSTPRQIVLQQALGYATPQYTHVPLVLNVQGEKLSKQTRAPALSVERAGAQLWQALRHLKQMPPAELQRASLTEVWQFALANWDESQLCAQPVAAPCGGMACKRRQ